MERAIIWVAGLIGAGFNASLRTLRRPLGSEVAVLRERVERLTVENVLLRARLLRVAPRRRPRYKTWERLQILLHRARYGMSIPATARAFVVTPQTIRGWLAAGAEGVQRLIRTRKPMNALPDLIREVAGYLKTQWPSWGTRRIAGILPRMGLKGSRSSVQRWLKTPPSRRKAAAVPMRTTKGPLRATRPNHVWLIDFTRVGGLFRKLMIAAVVDLYSRKVLAIRALEREPSSRQAQDLLREALRTECRPKVVVTDHGKQFTADELGRLLKRRDIQHRFGAIGRSNSIATIERFWRSLKSEYARGLILFRSARWITKRLSWYCEWFNQERPHGARRLGTPEDAHMGKQRPATHPQETGILEIEYLHGEKRLPVLRFRQAA